MTDKIFFSSKADVLRTLSVHEELHIPLVHVVAVGQWRADAGAVLREIGRVFAGEERLAVRSSCRREDSSTSSSAGFLLRIISSVLSRSTSHPAETNLFHDWADKLRNTSPI